MKKQMKKILLCTSLLFAASAYSQVGINTPTPHPDSDLTLASDDKGLLLNRVRLTNTTDASPLATPENGMMIYNISTDITSSNPLYPIIPGGVGVYYWDNTGWVSVKSQTGGAAIEPWYVAGTTTPATANNQNIYQTGRVGIGNSNPSAPLTVGSDNGVFPGQVYINPQNTTDEGGELILAASPSSARRWVLDQHNGGAYGGQVLRLWSQDKTTTNADGTDFVFKDNGTTEHPAMGINAPNPGDMLNIRATKQSGLGPAVGGILIDNTYTSSYSRLHQGYLTLHRDEAFAGHVGGYIDFSGAQGGGNVFRIAKTHVPGVIEALTMNIGGQTDINGFAFYLHNNNQVSIGHSSRQPGFALTVANGIASNGYATKHGVNGGWTGNRFNIPWDGTSAGIWIDGTFLGNFSYTSDYRLKKNVNTITTNAIDRVMQLRPVTYEYKDIQGDIFKSDNKVHEGFIAHELQAIIADAVNGVKDATTSEGKIQPQTLNAMPVISVLTKAIQEQQAQIEELKQRIEQLERR